MDGSLSRGSTYDEWEAKRKFIAELIDDDGTILDVGCANGFFLRSLQEWTGRQLTPFGIDIRPELICSAKRIFSELDNNFAVVDATDIEELENVGLPLQYKYVFWNFLGSWDIGLPKWKRTFNNILRLGTRRVIVGFYGTNRYTPHSDKWHAERDRLLRMPSAFTNAGFEFSGFKLNPAPFNQLVGWFDVSTIGHQCSLQYPAQPWSLQSTL